MTKPTNARPTAGSSQTNTPNPSVNHPNDKPATDKNDKTHTKMSGKVRFSPIAVIADITPPITPTGINQKPILLNPFPGSISTI